MSIPRRLGRLARGFVSTLQEDERFRETLRVGRERGETLRDTFGEAFGAAWRGAAEEWRIFEEEERVREQQSSERSYQEQRRASSTTFRPRRYPLNVINAYTRLGLEPGAPLEEVNRKRRELVKRFHPDRFSDPAKRARAERLTAEINAAHDTIASYLLRGR